MLFEKTKCERSTVRTQYEEKFADRWETVFDCISEMLDDSDGFVTLTLADIKHNIRYVQSALVSDGLTVQLGIEEENGTRLVEKLCSENECIEIFREFYNTTNVANINEYSEVKFL